MHRNTVDDWWDGQGHPGGSKVKMYILRQMTSLSPLESVSDPIDMNDEDELDNCLVDLLGEHPFDERPRYWILTIDLTSGEIDLTEADDMQALTVEAWEDWEEEDDDADDPPAASRPGHS